MKYGFDDVRNVLERASARETAARVALGCFCKAFLAELGIQVVSHVVRIGRVATRSSRTPLAADLEAVDASPVRCLDGSTGERMVAEIDAARRAKDTVGGVFEVVAYGCPPGLGSHASAGRPGSKAHDGIVTREGRIARTSAHAGGIEGGMSTGQPIRVRAAMKPFSTVPKALPTVDLATGADAVAITQRTDVCAVPAGAVVGEAAAAFVLADAVLEKFGGDSVRETGRNLDAFVEGLP